MRPTLIAMLGVVLLSGCGWSVGSAREAAAQKSCDFYKRCNDIGQGQTYATMDECMTKQRANWLDTWPTNSCEGKLSGANVDICLNAIEATQCNNVLDLLATASKCARDKVCP